MAISQGHCNTMYWLVSRAGKKHMGFQEFAVLDSSFLLDSQNWDVGLEDKNFFLLLSTSIGRLQSWGNKQFFKKEQTASGSLSEVISLPHMGHVSTKRPSCDGEIHAHVITVWVCLLWVFVKNLLFVWELERTEHYSLLILELVVHHFNWAKKIEVLAGSHSLWVFSRNVEGSLPFQDLVIAGIPRLVTVPPISLHLWLYWLLPYARG